MPLIRFFFPFFSILFFSFSFLFKIFTKSSISILFVYFLSLIFPFLQSGETPLFLSSREGHIEAVKELLKWKANIDAPREVSGRDICS